MMAALKMSATRLSQVAVLMVTLTSLEAFEFQVGGSKGWSVPQVNDTKFYSKWAEQNRFQLGDTLRFEYSRDSVLEVSEEGYKNCNSSEPSFFSNTGKTVLKLDDHGPFYFISGISRHCRRGQRVIVKVKAPGESLSDGSKSSAPPVGASIIAVAVFFLSSVAFVVV